MINTDTGETLSHEEMLRFGGGCIGPLVQGGKYTLGSLIDFIKTAHGSQTRKDGSPYYLHPVAVAGILDEWMTEARLIGICDGVRGLNFDRWAEQSNSLHGHDNQRYFTLMMMKAALCHDLLEDTDITPKRLAVEVGEMVTSWVQYVTKPAAKSINKSLKAYQAYSRLQNAPDPVKWLKLADRYHNLSCMRTTDMAFRQQYLADTQLLLSVIGMPFTAYPMQKVQDKYWEECKAFHLEFAILMEKK